MTVGAYFINFFVCACLEKICGKAEINYSNMGEDI